MSDYRNFHEFDFDVEMHNMMYGMTDYDIHLSKYGHPKMKELGNRKIDPKGFLITWSTDIIGCASRSIEFVLTYRVRVDSWFGSIRDSDETFSTHFDVSDDSAYFMTNIEEFEDAKDRHKVFKKRQDELNKQK